MRLAINALFIFLIGCGLNLPGGPGKTGSGGDPLIPKPGGPVDIPIPTLPTNGFIGFSAFESDMLSDLTSSDSARQINAFWLTVCDQYNAGDLTQSHRDAVVKVVNQLSLEKDIEPGIWIGQYACTLSLDLRDYGLTRASWRIIERADPLKFESFTDRGLLVKQLTQSRRPWMLASNFIETSLTGETYYDVLGIPNYLDDFLDNFLGCTVQRDFDDFNVYIAGVRRSLIALQKNRSILVMGCRDGTTAITYDTILERITSPGRNLSILPFPREARTNKTFEHDASEIIVTLPNDLQGFALFNGQGTRENFAPTNVVVDNLRANIDPTIRNSRSCFACHTTGYIEVGDYIASHVTGNPNFNAEEIQKAKAYFGRNDGMTATLRQANAKFEWALSQMNISTGRPDAINELTDQIRTEMDARQVASILFMTENDFKQQLTQSRGGTLAIGQLLTGGTINFQDLVQIAPTLILDLNLFQEDLGQ